MITIDLLKNHPESIPKLAKIWHESLGKLYFPDTPMSKIEFWFHEWLNDSIPLAHIAICNNEYIGSCSLQYYDGIREDLTPWLGDLVIDPNYRNQGIAKKLIDATKHKAKSLGFNTLYLFTLDQTIHQYYESLGWQIISKDQYLNQPVTVMQIEL
ncbi:GNAT family N-acetyltransferase [Thiotrichales bacterium 19S9-12]|nr:GNAT family N-acetyltransferase [Thiotrichales bacterium 19S9-11]MCF6811127.1 GNAT family N-acetyltransferase [Thiotrichales bacterium 19S9-12]